MMKKVYILIISLLLLGIAYMLFGISSTYLGIASEKNLIEHGQTNMLEALFHEDNTDNQVEVYNVHRYDKLDKTFDSYEEALNYATSLKRSYITKNQDKNWIWDNFDKFIVYSKGIYLNDFSTLEEAYTYAKNYEYGRITYESDRVILWDRQHKVSKEAMITVDKILQYPELPRGCEVTSLAMLLNYHQVNVTKMDLAKEVKKVKGIYYLDGKQYYGNPNKGFVGNMYSLTTFGYGVYHEPIYDLTANYFPDLTIDLTGSSFDELYYFIDQGNPIWVNVNTTFKPLKKEQFKTWQTESGLVKVTNKQHAVIITGYDEKYLYINDPLNNAYKVEKKKFIEAWEQMGNQAITVIYIEES